MFHVNCSDTARPLTGDCPDDSSDVEVCCVGCGTDTDWLRLRTSCRTFASIGSDAIRPLHRRWTNNNRLLARIIQRMIRGRFGRRPARCGADIARPRAIHSCKGMVSRKNHGFPIPESRQKFRSSERIKIVRGCADDNALNGRSETGSETEQVGSEMNGRR